MSLRVSSKWMRRRLRKLMGEQVKREHVLARKASGEWVRLPGSRAEARARKRGEVTLAI
jgi:hypothetical protein